MSLKQFLAVGKSFEDVPEGNSPFEMRPEVRLPQFQAEPRFTARQAVPVQTDWLAENSHRPVEPKGEVKAKKSPKRIGRSRSWLEVLTFGFWGKAKGQGELVQEEMVLEKVKVIRNDLADSDLEVVVKKGQKFALRAVKAGAPTQVEAERGHSGPQVESSVGGASALAPIGARKESDTGGQECPRSNPRKKPKRFEWTELTVRLFEIGQH